ncbi:hypothetical protein QR680_002319 [Steinernema hermaphroditum]|uniref:EF-hand domain-containing protein n=1 Tax=Steinernema hermaphroditum TaxID=289476 RepID=A0AA39H289_9BILA|nr:hypothetical protein QR680_002319 [Steinernema hermaphroditum]
MKVPIVVLCVFAFVYSVPVDFTSYNGRSNQQYGQPSVAYSQDYGTAQDHNSLHMNNRIPYFNSYPVSGSNLPYHNGQNGSPNQSSHGSHDQSPYAGVLPKVRLRRSYLSIMTALSSFFVLISLALVSDARTVYRHDAREMRLRDTSAHLNDLLFISKLAFNFLDANVDHGLSLSEMKFLVGHSLNGMVFRTEKDVEKLFNAMDRNDDSVVSENEFLMFDKWLHAVVHKNAMENGGKVSIARLKEFATKRHLPFYTLLDADNDGYLTTNELNAFSSQSHGHNHRRH